MYPGNQGTHDTDNMTNFGVHVFVPQKHSYFLKSTNIKKNNIVKKNL